MKNKLEELGYQIIEKVYSNEEIEAILAYLETAAFEKKFGVRAFLIDHPILINLLFTDRLKAIIQSISTTAKPIKSLYFDKPPSANWIVNWHQDLTINVEGQTTQKGFKNWRVLPERTVVQPPLDFLENIFTIRIHLDDCLRTNGALQVVKASHQEGVIPMKDWLKNKEGERAICEVKKGGILLMKPLLLHASKRTENNKNRRVVHIEFCDMELPTGLAWKERILIK